MLRKLTSIHAVCLVGLFLGNFGNASLADTEKNISKNPIKRILPNAAKGDITIVQDYPLRKKYTLEIAGSFGTLSTDPFLDVRAATGYLGFHPLEWLAVNAVFRKLFVSDSSALDSLRHDLGVGTNVNRPMRYTGGQVDVDLAAGKLTYMGRSIFYYDLYVNLGGGISATENGNYPTLSYGLGQHIYLTRAPNIALKIDLGQTLFRETIIQRIIVSEMNSTLFQRTNLSTLLTVGLSVGL